MWLSKKDYIWFLHSLSEIVFNVKSLHDECKNTFSVLSA